MNKTVDVNTIRKHLNIPENEIQYSVQNVQKIYPNYSLIYKYNKTYNIIPDGFEQTIKVSKPKTNKGTDLAKSLRRSKTIISDLVICNQFELFCTFTFANDRQNTERNKKRMSDWLKSSQKQYGKFKYLIVPEFHKDGKSIHFHALISNFTGNMEFSGIQQRGRKVYNITNYKNGFSTAVFIDDPDKVATYMKKYITKDMPLFNNKRRYWHSTNLVYPQIKYNVPISDGYCEIYKSKYFSVLSNKLV